MPKESKFIVFQGSKWETSHLWYWHLRAPNGKLICSSGEGFSSASNARRNIRLVAWTMGALLGADHHQLNEGAGALIIETRLATGEKIDGLKGEHG